MGKTEDEVASGVEGKLVRQRLLVVAILIVIAEPASSTTWIVPGKSIGKIQIGMSLTEVRKILGEPDTIEPGKNGVTHYGYPSTSYHFSVRIGKDERVRQLDLIARPGADWTTFPRTKSLITLGSPVKSIIKLYGHDHQANLTDDQSGVLSYDQLGIHFLLMQGKCFGFAIFAPGVPK